MGSECSRSGAVSAAAAKPRITPAEVSRTLSTNACRSKRALDAPSATLTARSRSRAEARAICRPAILAQAMSNTMPTAISSMVSGRRMGPGGKFIQRNREHAPSRRAAVTFTAFRLNSLLGLHIQIGIGLLQRHSGTEASEAAQIFVVAVLVIVITPERKSKRDIQFSLVRPVELRRPSRQSRGKAAGPASGCVQRCLDQNRTELSRCGRRGWLRARHRVGPRRR